MLARRYSGRVKVVCRFRDEQSDYACELYVDGHGVGCCYVGLPGAWATLPEYRGGVDSDDAFDGVARAALNFAMVGNEDEEAVIDSDDVEWDDAAVVVHRRPPPPTDAPDSQGSLDFGRRRP